MCGICGYLGYRKAIPIVLDGIKKLEYRGYDSSGIVTIVDEGLVYKKEPGRVEELERDKKILDWPSKIALAHTRWATHGRPTSENAHPHCDSQNACAVVHNGIIENHEAIRRLLIKRGVVFHSETDTEVIPQLIGYLYKGDFLKAVQSALWLLEGSFAIAVIHKKHPDTMICAARESPLAIGIGHDEMFVASDSQAFLKHTKRVIYLHGSELALITPHSIQAFTVGRAPIAKECQELEHDVEEVTKGDFQHYMHKEIFEQPQTVQNALLSRYCEEYGTAILDEIKLTDKELLNIQRIVILACGSSFHAGLIGMYMLQEKARIPVEVEISSEFRYKNPIILKNTLVIAISQSGETADTLAAMRELREKGAKIIGICNVQNSTLSREVDGCIFLRAGPEIGVASTKAFTSQLTVLALLTLRFARMRLMSQQEGKQFIQALVQLPGQIRKVLDQEKTIQAYAEKYAHYDNFFFLGRRYMYPTAREGALKVQEIAYIHANGYAAGEMKHGPIALINEQFPTVGFCADSVTFLKILNNLMEIKARNGKILAIAAEGQEEILKVTDDVIFVPKTIDELAPVLSAIVAQLFAYHTALTRKTEIDKPRNLAKSVTVE